MISSAEVPLLATEKKNSTSLLSLLKDGREKTFSQRCAEERGNLDKNHGKEGTYLQLACLYGLPKAVKALLTNGADPNRTYYSNLSSPIMIAGQQGYCNIVKMLAQHNKVNFPSTAEGTVLHAMLKGMLKARERGDFNFFVDKYVNCMKLILTEKRRLSNVLDINAQDKDGFTALHLAVTLQEKSIILLLLEHGAYIGSRCSQGYTPISLMNANVFEEYLNNCIDTNGELPINMDYKFVYDYSFLEPKTIFRNKQELGREEYRLISEIEPLVEISCTPKLCHLLEHPVLASFLLMKWSTVRFYFWVNFTFYLAFCLCLTLHTLAKVSLYGSKEKEQGKDVVAWWTWFPSIFLCGLLGLREFLKFCILAIQYASDVENLLIVALFTSNVLVLSDKVVAEVAPIALFLTWIEFFLIINRHPFLSTDFEKFKKLCTRFLKVLLKVFMLIVPGALSYYLYWQNEQQSLMTAKLETNSKHVRSHIIDMIFILYVFLIFIISFNVMYIYAVYYNLTIRNNPRIIRYTTAVRQIAFIEKMINNLLCCVMSNHILERQIKLFPRMLPSPRVYVHPNHGNRFHFSNTRHGRYPSLWLTWEFLDKTREILGERERKREENEAKRSDLLKAYEDLNRRVIELSGMKN